MHEAIVKQGIKVSAIPKSFRTELKKEHMKLFGNLGSSDQEIKEKKYLI